MSKSAGSVVWRRALSDHAASMVVATTLASLISQFTTFLTVAIHTILYERLVYPPDSFLSARKYNFAVRQSRHPKVCQWINDAVNAIEAELLKGIVSRVAVVIFHPVSCKPLERFMFDVSRFPVVPPGEITTPFEREIEHGAPTSTNDKGSVDLDEQLRAVMSKLAVCSSRLQSIPKGCSFTICIELKDDADAPIGHPQPWVPSEPALQRTAMGRTEDGQGVVIEKGKALGGARTTPLRSVEAGEMLFETWIEEGSAKSDPSYNVTSSGETSSSTG